MDSELHGDVSGMMLLLSERKVVQFPSVRKNSDFDTVEATHRKDQCIVQI